MIEQAPVEALGGSYLRYAKDADPLVLLLWVLLENFGYRQLGVFWRLQGMVKYLLGGKDWEAMQREGFNDLKLQRKNNSK